MTKSYYEQLSAMTVIVADTGDIKSIETFKPRDATTNPSLITAASQMDAYSDIVDGTLRQSRREIPGGDEKKTVALAIDRLSVAFGLRILQIVSGRVSTEVDARLSYDMAASIEKARTLIGYYEQAGISRERVLIKMASTWEGIKAAEQVQKEGIRCNLTLNFGMHQAIACAEAGVQLISPFVGRILDWHKKSTGRDSYPPAEDPGVLSVTRIYNYFKRHGHKTEVMGASFRTLDEIVELAGCDLLTIAPNFLDELCKTTGTLARKLDPARAASMQIEKIPMDESRFRAMHEEDQMAKDKLAEGIEGFSNSIVALEKILTKRLAALDVDGDGRVTTPDRAAAGVGAALNLQKGTA